jgi:DNA polymerase-3 subunit delta'
MCYNCLIIVYQGIWMNLKDIFCQGRAINSMQRAFAAGRQGHAYIFAGADGIGKFSAASAWAKMLLCGEKVQSDGPDGVFYDSCGHCESCMVFDGGGHPDFKAIYKELVVFTKDGKNKKTPIDLPKDVITEFLIEKVASKPKMGEYSVYVVKESHRLNASSQNALLKVLEEPPGYCVIILLCNSIEKMLPTTRSRCQVVRFGEIDENIIVEKLVQMSVDPQQAKYWARFSESSLGMAMDWASVEVGENGIYGIKREIVSALSVFRLGDCLDLAERMLAASKKISEAFSAKNKSLSKTDLNRRATKGLIRMVISAFSDVIRLGVGDGDSLINCDQRAEIEFFARRFSPDGAADKVAKAYENLRWVDCSVNEKLIYEELLLNIAGCSTI